MGLDLGSGASNVPINFTKDEINAYVKRFKSLDRDNKGYISVNDLRRYFKVSLVLDDVEGLSFLFENTWFLVDLSKFR
jgi:Ca2+-binding EF-hand superfamily protein